MVNRKTTAELLAWMAAAGISCMEPQSELQEVADFCENASPRSGERKYFMASRAYHMIHGEIVDIGKHPDSEGRALYDLCQTYAEFGNFRIGMWVFGIGVFNVIFPKATMRELDAEEKKKYGNLPVMIGSQPGRLSEMK